MRAFLIVVGVLLVGVVALGFYQGWFNLTVNKDKMKEDAQGAEKAVQGLGRQSNSPATGRITKLEAADSRFVMTTADNKALTMYTGPSSMVRLNDKEVKLERLQVEDEVKVAYDLKDGKNLASSVTVSRAEASEQSPRRAD